MKTYAIWYEKKDLNCNEQAEIEVHFNLWKLPKSNRGNWFNRSSANDQLFLDFGLKLVNRKDVKSIKLFLPFNLSKTDIYDLGEKFLRHTDLITGVFNDDYPIESGFKPKQIKVNEGPGKYFIIYTLDVENHDCNLESKYSGTILSINIPEDLIDTDEPLYYRFRISTKELDDTMKRLKYAGHSLEIISADTHIIDFRVNEKRLYDRSMSEKIRSQGEFKFSKLHFLLMTNSQDEVMTWGENPSSRQIEESIWSKYVGEEYNLSNVFAYHWKQKSGSKPITSHNSLIKIRVQKSNATKLVTYLIWLAVLSIIFNIATECVLWVWNNWIK